MFLHEDFSRQEQVNQSSERAFGITFAICFLLVGLWPVLISNGEARWLLIILSGLILAISLARPKWLFWPSKLWMKLGLMLSHLTSPVAIGIIFFLVVTPIALIMRALGHDPMRRNVSSASGSYWIERDPPGPSCDSLKNQF